MEVLDDRMDMFNIVVGIAKYAADIGPAAAVLKNALSVAHSEFDIAYSRVQAVDSVISPLVDSGEVGVDLCEAGM